jgi:putative spermidine/putrescine transport system substrate-binding protein
MNMRIIWQKALVMSALLASTIGAQPVTDLTAGAKTEGEIATYGCPADWAGYGFVSDVMTKTHGLKWTDSNMTSADAIERLTAEKDAPVADIIDIGLQFAPTAVKAGVLLPYKNSQWESIPEWAKDSEGLFAAAYYGTVAFLVNTKKVPNVPKTWKDLLKPEYKGLVTIQDPREAANAQFAVIAASMANGGSENDLDPGIKFFAELRKSGNLIDTLPDKDTLTKGEAGIGLLWDFQGLAWRRDMAELEVLIPSDGSTSGLYTAVINKASKHPNAAKLWIETMLSDEGQVAFARSGARPIRSVPLPQHISEGLLPEAQYTVVKPIENWKDMEAISKKIGERWTAEVLGAK